MDTHGKIIAKAIEEHADRLRECVKLESVKGSQLYKAAEGELIRSRLALAEAIDNAMVDLRRKLET